MQAHAVIIKQPNSIGLDRLTLKPAGEDDVVVDALWSGVSTGTEKLLFEGRMPYFPGLAYPLVPGYETVGRIVEAGNASGHEAGELVFVPGAHCFEEAAGLFGATAARLVLPGDKAITVPEAMGPEATLLALAATAHHAIAGGPPPQLVVGHGVLGRLIARIAIALGHPAPTVWENDPARRDGAAGYAVTTAEDDERSDYAAVMDASGFMEILDTAIGRLARGGEVALAGFYSGSLSFAFAPAFMREARIRIAAEFRKQDIAAVLQLTGNGALDLTGLISRQEDAGDAERAYPEAFADRHCLKMILDWRSMQ